MRPTLLLFHPQLRTSLPQTVRRDLSSRLFARLKTTTNSPTLKTPRTPKEEAPLLKTKDGSPAGLRTPGTSPAAHAKSAIRRGTNDTPIKLGLHVDLRLYRTTGAHSDLSWRNGSDTFPGNATIDHHIPLRRIMSPRCAGLCR